jgi:tRNA uridine 5-carbamoylmethylation protein Kti12
MEEYKNIMKLIDTKLAEQEGVIEYYRNKQKEWEEQTSELTSKNLQLEATISDLKADNEKYINEIKRMDAVNSDLKQANEYLKEKLNDF